MEKSSEVTNGKSHNESQLKSLHPNGRVILDLRRPARDDTLVFENVFPETELGQLLHTLVVTYLIKQEHRIGWARKGACDNPGKLDPYPNESVASHQWGVAWLISVLRRSSLFREELPDFDALAAFEMATIHDVPELVVGDIVPPDNIPEKVKHQLERDAMDKILGSFPNDVRAGLVETYDRYERRQCNESKVVKDCDRLDFIIHAFLLERQGFVNLDEFYDNTVKAANFNTKIAAELAKLLIETRKSLTDSYMMFPTKIQD